MTSEDTRKMKNLPKDDKIMLKKTFSSQLLEKDVVDNTSTFPGRYNEQLSNYWQIFISNNWGNLLI